MKYLVIYNPHAASGAAAKKVNKVKRSLDEEGLDYVIAYTERSGHAVEIAAREADTYDVIVAAGGDGTAHEVINGIMQHKSRTGRAPAFGMLCVGRGNDVGFSAGIPKKVDAGCAALGANCRKRIDVGLIAGTEVAGDRYFINGIGIGFDAIVDNRQNRSCDDDLDNERQAYGRRVLHGAGSADGRWNV